ncbi:tRNA1(Val) (adenine(37)-N6)-methyltransferase [Alphaproteobacteria bacterium LSUCC0684]
MTEAKPRIEAISCKPDLLPADAMASTPLTRDSWYDGSLTLWQPRDGFRATTDAVLLAAAVDGAATHALELGAGGGAATLALARRCGEMRITAVERDPLMAGLLRRNIETNALTGRISALHADIFNDEAAYAWREQHDHVYFNPPYNDAASTLSGDERRKASMAAENLNGWIRAGIRALVPRGQITLVSRADRLPEILVALEVEKTGSIVLRMVHAEAHLPAIRILVRARKGIAGRLEILPPLVMREGAETLTGKMKAISHHRDEISMTAPGRQYRKPRLAPRPDKG